MDSLLGAPINGLFFLLFFFIFLFFILELPSLLIKKKKSLPRRLLHSLLRNYVLTAYRIANIVSCHVVNIVDIVQVFCRKHVSLSVGRIVKKQTSYALQVK